MKAIALFLFLSTISLSAHSATFSRVSFFQSLLLKNIDQSYDQIITSVYRDGYIPVKHKVKIKSVGQYEPRVNSLKQLLFILNPEYSTPEFFYVTLLRKNSAKISSSIQQLYNNCYFSSYACSECLITKFTQQISLSLNYNNIEIYKIYHGNTWGESKEFAIIDNNTNEILVFGLGWAE